MARCINMGCYNIADKYIPLHDTSICDSCFIETFVNKSIGINISEKEKEDSILKYIVNLNEGKFVKIYIVNREQGRISWNIDKDNNLVYMVVPPSRETIAINRSLKKAIERIKSSPWLYHSEIEDPNVEQQIVTKRRLPFTKSKDEIIEESDGDEETDKSLGSIDTDEDIESFVTLDSDLDDNESENETLSLGSLDSEDYETADEESDDEDEVVTPKTPLKQVPVPQIPEHFDKIDWASYLNLVVSQSDDFSKGFKELNNYSLRNQIILAGQMRRRNIPLSKVMSKQKWKEKGFSIKKGELPLNVIVPIKITARKTINGKKIGPVNVSPSSHPRFFEEKINFIIAGIAFAKSQTNATEKDVITIKKIPNYDPQLTLDKFKMKISPWKEAQKEMKDNEIKEFTFDTIEGFSWDDTFSINPIAKNKLSTFFHEIGHVLLGHNHERKFLPNSKAELEAESVAMICLYSLGIKGVKDSEKYIREWYKGKTYPKESARIVVNVAGKILRSGYKFNK